MSGPMIRTLDERQGHGIVKVLGCAVGGIVVGIVVGMPLLAAMVLGVWAGIYWRGVTVVLPGLDRSIQYKVYGRPRWFRWAMVVVALVLVIMAVGDGGKPQLAFLRWVVYLVIIGGSVASALALGGLPARRAHPDNSTPEDQAVARVDNSILGSAGMTWRSAESGDHLYPVIEGMPRGIDEKGRAYFDAQIMAGTQTLGSYEKAADRIASGWQVPRVIITSPATGVVRITAVIREWSRTGIVAWQAHPAFAQGIVPDVVGYLRNGLRIGEVDQTDEAWMVYPGKSYTCLTSGVMGSGKTSSINVKESFYVMHPHIDVIHIDLKSGQALGPWVRGLSAFATGPNGGLELLTYALAQMLGERAAEMRAAGVTNAWNGRPDGTPFLGAEHHVRVIIVDEIQEIFEDESPESRRISTQAARVVRAFARKCRSYGYIIQLATQRPTSEALPTMIRENISPREAFRITPSTVQYALTPRWYEARERVADTPDPSAITEDQVGRAVVEIDGRWTFVQAAFLADAEIEQIAADAQPHTVRFTDWRTVAPTVDLDALLKRTETEVMDELEAKAGWLPEPVELAKEPQRVELAKEPELPREDRHTMPIPVRADTQPMMVDTIEGGSTVAPEDGATRESKGTDTPKIWGV